MIQQGYLLDLGNQKSGITNAAPLSTAPAYGTSPTNPLFKATDGSRMSRKVQLEVDVTGAGTGDVVVTIWRGVPTTQRVGIAEDQATAGVWTIAYAGAAKKACFLVDTWGLDVGVTVTVSAVNITAVVNATAIFEDNR